MSEHLPTVIVSTENKVQYYPMQLLPAATPSHGRHFGGISALVDAEGPATRD